MNEGRDTNGRFGTGNGYGKGRPARAVEQECLETLSEACTPERWKNIIERAITDAEQGDAKARMFLAGYLMGRPVQRMQVSTEMNLEEIADRAVAQLHAMKTR